MSGATRQWIRTQRDHLVRLDLERQGYVLDWFLVYRAPFAARMTATLVPAVRRPAVLRNAARGSSRRLHEQRMARM